ncbi:MAG TPA: sigma-70 family RNA polymerase sigma factor [Verrucomicrobiae bacterium]
MNDSTDHFLLQAYAENRSEAAFAELERRYFDFVYCAALRMVREEHAAQDVTQSVFMALARDARNLASRNVLAGWLHRTTQNLACNVVRSDVRRRSREQEVASMNESASDESDALWERIAPQLDAALAHLSQNDRDALLLRYFQNKRICEVARILETTEHAAQKRVNRAVERLRKIMARYGVVAEASGLSVCISTHAVQSTPAAVASATSSAGILARAALATETTTKGFMFLQKALVTTALVTTVGAALYALHLRSEIRSLQQRESLLTSQLDESQRERDEAVSRAALLQMQSESFQQGSRDLARLRAEVSRLRVITPSTASTASATPPSQQWTNMPIQVNIEAKFVSLSDDALKSLQIQWTPDPEGGSHGFLTADLLEGINQALTNGDDVHVISVPRVTTLNGRRAKIASTTPAELSGTNANLGATLDVTADFSTNDSTFNLQFTAQLTELTGDPLQPQLYKLEAANQATLPRGQTVALTRELSANAWLPDYTNTSGLPRNLIVLVTPEVIDAAGNVLPPWPQR